MIFAVLALLGASPARAERAGTVGLDLNYPGVGVRYFVQNQSAIEARGQFADGNKLGGARFYQYLTNAYQNPRGLDLFVGLEGDYVSFKGSSANGEGAAGSLFAGGEYFFSPRWSVQLDGGPAYMTLKDSGTSLGITRFDVVVNFGINLYFGGRSDEGSYVAPVQTAPSSTSKAHNDEVTP